jgi:hypothetical protein
MSLARATAFEFAQNAGDERDFDITVSPRAALKAEPGNGSTSPHE